ncbi:hypothetical protein AK812_SmicGene40478 [Symbiodinium microadriaticum]|uniref:Uncharacterized protein n=1 Tax=Symbiodinium microadriaticum TaxID=2951 RepID=A0A1Q9C8J4_SYMMI|nr:hypothetical protein AK812_SmicGene40478 [Symbiodinium microadriaticum]CAE7347044.1 unnamed protein product [Symbiodinium sp. KB8]CAE7869094.1 unnamed protein product [Symbiodinium microadriaticum]
MVSRHRLRPNRRDLHLPRRFTQALCPPEHPPDIVRPEAVQLVLAVLHRLDRRTPQLYRLPQRDHLHRHRLEMQLWPLLIQPVALPRPIHFLCQQPRHLHRLRMESQDGRCDPSSHIDCNCTLAGLDDYYYDTADHAQVMAPVFHRSVRWSFLYTFFAQVGQGSSFLVQALHYGATKEDDYDIVTVEDDLAPPEEDPYDVGANVVICGGARKNLHGAHAMILPAAAGAAAFCGNEATRTVMLTDHRHGPRGKLVTVDLQHLRPGPMKTFSGDDGMEVSLRWRLYPLLLLV